MTRLSISRWQQAIAALIGLAIAFAGALWAVHTVGRVGRIAVVLAVPAGLFFGWLTAKLFGLADRMLRD